ncbi:MAG: class I SAM-dependent methyltransferase, partial [Anaerolineales bacterium]
MDSIGSESKKSMSNSENESLLTGEFILPGAVPPRLYEEHIARYTLAASLSSGKCVLDVACGTGYGAAFLIESGARKVVGGDLSPAALSWASRF